jgi:hypothetical protein
MVREVLVHGEFSPWFVPKTRQNIMATKVVKLRIQIMHLHKIKYIVMGQK